MGYLAQLAGGGARPPQPNSLGPPPDAGSLNPPSMPGAPPAPTGVGKMPTGNAGGTKVSAAGELIAAARAYIGFEPSMQGDLEQLIAQVKASSQKGKDPGPAVGEPGIPGSGQMESGQQEMSGSPGAM